MFKPVATFGGTEGGLPGTGGGLPGTGGGPGGGGHSGGGPGAGGRNEGGPIEGGEVMELASGESPLSVSVPDISSTMRAGNKPIWPLISPEEIIVFGIHFLCLKVI